MTEVKDVKRLRQELAELQALPLKEKVDLTKELINKGLSEGGQDSNLRERLMRPLSDHCSTPRHHYLEGDLFFELKGNTIATRFIFIRHTKIGAKPA